MRWKPALNAVAITFADRWPPVETGSSYLRWVQGESAADEEHA